MKTHDFEIELSKIHYSIQDLDLKISGSGIPETQIYSARQVADIQREKALYITKRNFLREQCIDLEKKRQRTLFEKDSNKDMQQLEGNRLSKIAIATSIVLEVVGKLIK